MYSGHGDRTLPPLSLIHKVGVEMISFGQGQRFSIFLFIYLKTDRKHCAIPRFDYYTIN